VALTYGRWKRNPLRVISLIVTGAILVPLWFALPAVAQQNGDFSCRAAAVRAELGGNVIIEEPVANEPQDPCRDDENILLEVPDELAAVLVADTLTARTRDEDDEGSAFAQVEGAVLLGGLVSADVLTARASATCDNGDARLRSESEIVGLEIQGQAVPVDEGKEQTIVIPEIATVFLNREIREDDTVTRRALEIVFFDGALANIVLAEAIADVERCAAAADDNPDDNDDGGGGGGPPPAACIDGIDNDGDGQIDFPNDPGCDSAQDNDERNNDERSVIKTGGRVCAAAGRSFVARVQGSSIRRVVFSLNGRKLATDTSAPFAVRVPASQPGTLKARVTYSGGRPGQTLSRRFGRCPAGPRFTG